MFIANLTDRGAGPALASMLAFTEARQRVIAENVANLGVPGYRTQSLDTAEFQRALRRALDERGADPNRPFRIGRTDEVESRADGTLKVTPSRVPQNILAHDGTDASIERQMQDLAETAMMHQAVTTLLQGRFESFRKAIRGQA